MFFHLLKLLLISKCTQKDNVFLTLVETMN